MAKATTNSQGAGGTPKIHVKQDMIDFIKTQGMTKALKRAGEISAKGTKGEAEFMEGVKRMYGANRIAAAAKTAGPNLSATSKMQPKPKTAQYAKGEKATMSKAPLKKSGGFSAGAKITGGVIAGAAALALTKNPKAAAAVASKVAPRAAKALGIASKVSPKSASSIMAKKIASIKETAATKSMSTAGRAAAKAKRPVSQSQYDAMKAQAAKKGIKSPMKKKATVGAGIGATTLKGDAAKKTTKRK